MSVTIGRNMTRNTTSGRLTSLDAYRGFVMFLMMAQVMRISQVASHFPGNAVWQFLGFHTDHVEWVGCSLHDMIQPSFSFLVGVALPYSIASRVAKGQSMRSMAIHALWRSLLLVLLGVFLRSAGRPETNWTFEDTLSQIGLGYPLLFLLGFRSVRTQWIAFGAILVGYWLAWALYPFPGPDFDYTQVKVPPGWPYHFQGFAAHWNKNSNFGTAFDQWFLNLFPRSTPFVANGGGYLTLSFIPTLGTMILGLIAGGWLKSEMTSKEKVQRFVVAGFAAIVVGLLLHVTGINPIVKSIWTPAWTLFSGGICFLFLALFYTVIDLRNHQKWAFPLTVIGTNSIAAYVIYGLLKKPIVGMFKTHLHPGTFRIFGEVYEPLLQGAAVLLTMWLILFWMYRRKLFLKI